MKDKVVSIVVTYNRKELLTKCLDSLANQSYAVDGIVLIDNASNDGTVEFVKGTDWYKTGLIDLHVMGTNTGGAGGFYEGLKIAKDLDCDWFWLMDDDTVPKREALEELLTASQNIKQDISFLSSSVYGPNGECMNVPNIAETKDRNGYRNYYDELKNGALRIADSTFVSFLVKKDAVSKCGLPYKDFFIWGDDTEYSMRLIKHYGPAYMVGKSEVVHLRMNAKTLSIRNEDDKKRIQLYYYFFRNILTNRRLYLSKKSFCSFLSGAVKTSITSLLTKHGLLKFFVIHKGIISYLSFYHKTNKYVNNQLNGGNSDEG